MRHVGTVIDKSWIKALGISKYEDIYIETGKINDHNAVKLRRPTLDHADWQTRRIYGDEVALAINKKRRIF